MTKRTFNYGRVVARRSLVRCLESYQASVGQAQEDLDAYDLPRPEGPTLDELQELPGRWPELMGIAIRNRKIHAKFIPVYFRNSRGARAMSSDLHVVLDRDGEPRLNGARSPGIHPHTRGSNICRGNVTKLFSTMVASNQVIASLDLIRRWRLGYKLSGVYRVGWEVCGWQWLHDVRQGVVKTAWDNGLVQDNRSGVVLPLEDALEGKVADYIHMGLRQAWVRPSEVRDPDAAPRECIGCQGRTLLCSCHEDRTCVGCQQRQTWCLCQDSRFIINRELRSGEIHATGVVPSGEYDGPCRECGGPGPNIVYTRTVGGRDNSSCYYCASCTTYGAEALKLRAEIAGDAK
jgi:hypothetical protein